MILYLYWYSRVVNHDASLSWWASRYSGISWAGMVTSGICIPMMRLTR